MRKLKIIFTSGLLILGMAIAVTGTGASADELAAPQYPGSVKERFSAGEGSTFYTQDPLDKVKAFYEQKSGVFVLVEDGSGRSCRDPGASSACVLLATKTESDHAFSLMLEDQQKANMGLPVNKEFHAACQKYDYLARSVFPLNDEGVGTPDALYTRTVGPVEKQIEKETKQESATRRQRDKSAEGQADREVKKKKQAEMKATSKRIKELKAEGKNDEAMALAMQMMQANQGDMAAGMAAAAEAKEKSDKYTEKLQQAYITFLKELAKQPAYATKIVTGVSQQRDYTSQQRDYTSQQRKAAAGKKSGAQDTINKLKALFGK